jgi:Outer membrane protein beta-barrel domain
MTALKTAIAAALLLPVAASAAELSYSYVEGGIGQTEIDIDAGGIEDVEGDTLMLSGSLAVTDNVHVFADFSTTDFDFDVDATTIRVGGGWNQGISESADFIARLAYLQAEVETPFGDDDEDGFDVGVGLRSAFAPNLELEGFIDYVDLGGDDSGDTQFSGAARYFFTPQFAVGAQVGIGDDTLSYGLTARYNFE